MWTLSHRFPPLFWCAAANFGLKKQQTWCWKLTNESCSVGSLPVWKYAAAEKHLTPVASREKKKKTHTELVNYNVWKKQGCKMGKKLGQFKQRCTFVTEWVKLKYTANSLHRAPHPTNLLIFPGHTTRDTNSSDMTSACQMVEQLLLLTAPLCSPACC